MPGLMEDWREESIKTRIETTNITMPDKTATHIEEKNPLKQGLKLTANTSLILHVWIEEKNPLKQGLKHQKRSVKLWLNKIEEKNPLKQGLKL